MNKDDEKEKIEGEKRTAVEVAKPSIEKRIKELNDQIQQTKIELVENKFKLYIKSKNILRMLV